MSLSHGPQNVFLSIEILCLARRMSLPVAEVPVDWSRKAGSKVSLVRDGFRMLSATE